MSRLVTAMTVLLATAALGQCSRDNDGRPHVVVGVQSFITYSPFFIAAAQGFFEDQGLDVELAIIPSGEHGLAQLVSGDLDVLSGFPGAGLLNLIGRGADIRMVADRGYMPAEACSYYSLMVRSEIGPGSVASLAGRPIRLDPTLPSFWLDKLLATEGFSIGDLEVVDFPAAGIPDAFRSGAIDLAMIGDPWKLVLERSGIAYEWASVKDWAPDSQFALVFYGSRLLREEPAIGTRFMSAYLRAVAQYNRGPTPENLDILVEGLGQPRDILEATCWLPIRPDGRSPMAFLDDFQDWALQEGLLDRRLSVNQVWDPNFIEAAARKLSRKAE